jgi:hypothetical protein
VLPLLRPTQDALLCYLRALSAEQWEVVTAAAPWRVRDVAAHLLGDQLGRLSRSRDDQPPPVRAPGEALGPYLHHFNAEWVTAMARLSTWVLLELLGDVGPRVVDHWQRLDLDAFGETVSWAGPDPAPVWLDCARDYTECWPPAVGCSFRRGSSPRSSTRSPAHCRSRSAPSPLVSGTHG